MHTTLTFITEALHLVTYVATTDFNNYKSESNCLYSNSLGLDSMTHFNSKALPTNNDSYTAAIYIKAVELV